jgi:ketosteroid isomerase-like protein
VSKVGELVTEGARAYAERGLDGLAETWHPDLVYEEDPLFPGADTYRGRDAVLARFREYEEQLGASEAVTERAATGPHGTAVVWSQSGTTAGTGIRFQHRWGWLVRERDGRAVYIRAYFDPDEALRAAGLEP